MVESLQDNYSNPAWDSCVVWVQYHWYRYSIFHFAFWIYIWRLVPWYVLHQVLVATSMLLYENVLVTGTYIYSYQIRIFRIRNRVLQLQILGQVCACMHGSRGTTRITDSVPGQYLY